MDRPRALHCLGSLSPFSEKSVGVGIVEWMAITAVLGWVVVRAIDSGQLTSAIVVGGAFALEAASNGVL